MSEQAWIADVAATGSSLWERLSAGARPGRDRDEVRDERWAQWVGAVGEGDPTRLERRLAWDGLRPRDVRPLLGPVRLPAGSARWSPASLPALLRRARATGIVGAHPAARSSEPLPFEAVWLPVVVVESARLRRAAPHGPLGPDAWASLERSLLRNLCHAGAAVLSRERRIQRETTDSTLARLVAAPDEARAEAALARDLVDRGLYDLLRDYPGLARLVCTLIAQWRRQASLLLARLREDAELVAERLGAELGRVDGLSTDLSDRHDRGATVMRLVNADGASVIYKPRDAGLEVAFATLLDELGSEMALPRAPTIAPRRGYYWMEDARPAALADADAASRYYRRAGGLLALLHLLHGSDAHLENVVAAGENPVLVDAETLLAPERAGAPPTAGGSATRAGWNRLDASVLRIGLLPRWVPHGAGGYDSGGLGPAWVQRDGVRAVRWRTEGGHPSLHVTDADLAPGRHVPRRDGRTEGAEEHVDDLIAGFLEVARALSRRSAGERRALAARFAGCRARVLPRATATYGAALLASVSADALVDGAARSVTLDGLHGPSTAEPDRPLGWPLARAERAALERLDVPRITVRVDRIPSRLRALWTRSGLDVVRSRLTALELADEVPLIEAAFYARVASASDDDQSRWRGLARAGVDEPDHPAEAPPLDGSAAVEEAERIASLLLEASLGGDDGSLTWLTPVVVHQARGFGIQPAGPRLYDGTVGIALFFGALARVTGAPRHAEAARAAVREIADDPAAAVAGLPPGGITGGASIVWALVRLADALDDPALLLSARTAGAALTPDRIAEDRAFDVSAGSAGALLAFLRLHDATGEEEWLERARACGGVLLSNRTGSPAAWPRAEGPPLTGLSHGVAGIAHALLSLGASTGEIRYADAAREALRYERLHFLPALGNWEDLRPGGPSRGPNVMHGWCNGAPGIGLARLPWRALDEQAAADLEVAIATTRAHAVGTQDHLCCGTLGRVELLLRAGIVLERPALVDEARAVTGAVVAHARSRGRYRFSSPELPPVTVPGVFRGLAGAGLQLLRIAEPDRVASPLLLD